MTAIGGSTINPTPPILCAHDRTLLKGLSGIGLYASTSTAAVTQQARTGIAMAQCNARSDDLKRRIVSVFVGSVSTRSLGELPRNDPLEGQVPYQLGRELALRPPPVVVLVAILGSWKLRALHRHAWAGLVCSIPLLYIAGVILMNHSALAGLLVR